MPPFDRYIGSKTGSSKMAFGAMGQLVTPSNDDDLEEIAKAVVVAAAGDLSIVPALNDPSDTVDFVDCHVGFIPPYRVRRVMASGTSAVVYTIDG